MEEGEIRKNVRKGYAKIAKKKSSCCGSAGISEEVSKGIGYDAEDLESVPDGADMGLGCGNPIALASLRKGETVLDLGSGGGLDCFIAAKKVGEKGRVIGVDMTPEMIDKARRNAKRGKYHNVEFRLGEIENLPVADNTVDAIISNCVINLSPRKNQVFKEAFRVLKPGGRLLVSDIVLLKKLPEAIAKSIEAYVGCLSGAIKKKEYVGLIEEAGFEKTKIVGEKRFPVEYMANDPTAKAVVKDLEVPAKKVREIAASVESVNIYAVKPKGLM